MRQEVPPALVQKFGEPGGLFDTVLQRLVAEWHRYQLDGDPDRLVTLHGILEAGLSQLRSLDLLLRAESAADTELWPDTPQTPDAEGQGVSSVYAADPGAASDRPPAGEAGHVIAPSRLETAMHLLDALHEALQEALGPVERAARAPASPKPAATGPTAPVPPELAVSGPAGDSDAAISPATAPPPAPLPGSTDPVLLVDESQELVVDAVDRVTRPLDGVFVREAFDVASTAELKRCRRFERSFSLLLIEIGSETDPRAGRVLVGNLREFDLVGRYEGGIFAVGLPETTTEGAQVIAHRLVGLLTRRGVRSEQRRFGIATYPTDGNTLTTIVRAARSKLSVRPTV